MTKDEIYKILKRYPFIEKAVKNDMTSAEFYVGKRKHKIEINKEVKILFEILDDVENSSSESHELFIINGIKKGKSDITMMQEISYERSAYYAKKQELLNKIYDCSISKGLVEYDEILKGGKK